MAVTASGIWHPDPGDAYSNVANLATMAESIEDAVGPYVSDTGWVDCTVMPGHSVQSSRPVQVRRIGPRVQMRWGISNLGLSANTTSDIIQLPPGFYPALNCYLPAIGHIGTAMAMIHISPSTGKIDIRTGPTLGSYYILDAASWLVN